MNTSAHIASLALGVVAACGLAACSDEELADMELPAAIVFTEIGGGSDTAIASSPQFRLIESQAALESLYSEQARFPPLAPPVVDFDQEAVYFATTGPRPTLGYGIGIEALQRVTVGTGIDGLEIFIETGSPGPGCTVGQAITSPYVLISFPRAELKSGVINVNLHEEVHHCNG